jgi:lipid A ethanolaminephosphotransferase
MRGMIAPSFTHRPDTSRLTIPATVEQLLAVASVFWLFSANQIFFAAALKERLLSSADSWGFAFALAVMLIALHFVLMALVSNRWTVKPLLAVLIVATASASYFMKTYGVYMDPPMLRAVLRTDITEARELFSWVLPLHLFLYAVLPLLLLWRVRVIHSPWRRATLVRVGSLLLACAALVGALLAVFQPFSSLMRNHKDVRYLITPANYVWSLARVARAEVRGVAGPRVPVGLDAVRSIAPTAAAKPTLIVLVVGETARAANWGLNGYARQTTPQLAKLPVVNFPHMSSCGTNTEVSLPCMFSQIGRRDYDEDRIQGSESLLHVLARAGVGVHWRDNQSGCKGVCDGLPGDTVVALNPPGLCDQGRCLDEGLFHGLDERLNAVKGTQVLVLHQLGNHGPSYFRRYPPQFAQFGPACQSDDLRNCSREEIVNAYDNSLLYTDHLLASLIGKLQAKASSLNAAVVYVSDHGESLGETNLFLHGMPYAIAPKEQTQVPMTMWFSAGFRQAIGLDDGCLKQRAAQAASHDNLFHTMLGLLEVRTSVYESALDLSLDCRNKAGVAVK